MVLEMLEAIGLDKKQFGPHRWCFSSCQRWHHGQAFQASWQVDEAAVLLHVMLCIWSTMFTVTVPCSYVCMSGKWMVVIGPRAVCSAAFKLLKVSGRSLSDKQVRVVIRCDNNVQY